ncbi:uncharacterized protein LJ264_014673 [Porphyrio hochstetteri]
MDFRGGGFFVGSCVYFFFIRINFFIIVVFSFFVVIIGFVIVVSCFVVVIDFFCVLIVDFCVVINFFMFIIDFFIFVTVGFFVVIISFFFIISVDFFFPTMDFFIVVIDFFFIVVGFVIISRYYTPRENTNKNGIPRQQATATKQNRSGASKEGLPNPPLALPKKPPAPEGRKSTSWRKPEPFALLTKAMEEEIAAALGNGNPEEILSSAFKLKVTCKDIRTLEKLQWLNDTVVNFYMALLVDRSNRKKGPSVFAFNTFFYLKLCSGGYSAVKRWDLFTKDIIFVPVHLSSH